MRGKSCSPTLLILALVFSSISCSQKPGEPFNNSHAIWTPDGTQLIFYSDRDGDDEIYIMNADGSKSNQHFEQLRNARSLAFKLCSQQ